MSLTESKCLKEPSIWAKFAVALGRGPALTGHWARRDVGTVGHQQ